MPLSPEALLGSLRGFAALYALYLAGLVAFDFECFREPVCRGSALREAARRSLPGAAFALLAGFAGSALRAATEGLGSVEAALLYSAALLLLFAVYDSVTMYLINGFTSLAVRGEASARVRARLLLEAATPFYWVMAGLALLLVQAGDRVVQPRTQWVAVAGGLISAVILYIVARRAQDKWVWTLRYLEAAGEQSAVVETLRNLMRMVRTKPVIALVVAGLAVALGAERSSYAFMAGALLYTVPVYRAVSLYAKHAFTKPEPGETPRSGGLAPEAVRAARDLFYTTVQSVATASLLFTLVPLASLLPRGVPAAVAIGLYVAALLAYRRLYQDIRGLNVLAPVMVELSRSLADSIRRVIQQSCSPEEGECCALARAGCEASTGLAPRLVEAACRRG